MARIEEPPRARDCRRRCRRQGPRDDLLDEFGFDTVDAGPLRQGCRVQRDTPGYGPRGTATIWNGEAAYRLSNKAHVVFEAFNIFDAKASDIDYFYASRLPGECGRGGRHASGSSAIRARR